MTIRMKEIAKLANVHESTVSMVLNNYPRISSETRDRVMKLVNEFNYHPNISARRLSIKKTFTIGVCLASFDFSKGFSIGFGIERILSGVGRHIENTDYDILLQVPKRNQPKPTLHLFNEQKVDGVIIVYPHLNDSEVKELEEKKLPVVLINGISSILDYVMIDNTAGASQAIEHLISLGRKRIGIINGLSVSASFKERMEVYRAVLKKHNLPFVEELSSSDHPTESAGYSHMKEMLSYKPDAIFAGGDLLGIGAMKAIKEAGLRIPDDIAVTGFDDGPESRSSVPPLTSVRQPFIEMGRAAAELIVNRVEKKIKSQQKKILPGELVIRGSTVANKDSK